jgi:hypothetical protein
MDSAETRDRPLHLRCRGSVPAWRESLYFGPFPLIAVARVYTIRMPQTTT